jgi:hypothetical protein
VSKTIKLEIPKDLVGWRAIRERALTIYWDRRKMGGTENEALFRVLDDCLRDDERGEA